MRHVNRSQLSYGALLDWHLKRRKLERAGGFNQFANAVGIHPLALWRIRRDQTLPTDALRDLIEKYLFNNNERTDFVNWRTEMHQAYLRAKDRGRALPRTKPDTVNETWRGKLVETKQVKTGAHWIESSDQLAIAWDTTVTDDTIAQESLTGQLHAEVKRKAQGFTETANRLNNAYGWAGVAGASRRLFNNIDCETTLIPERLGVIYSSVLELGSFLE